MIDVLFADSTIEFENSAVVWRAFGDFRSTDADFQDALILRKAEHTATLQQASLSAFYTFDAAALQLDGAVRPA